MFAFLKPCENGLRMSILVPPHTQDDQQLKWPGVVG